MMGAAGASGALFGLAAGALWALDGILLGRLPRGGTGVLTFALLAAGLHDAGAALFLLAHNARCGRLRDYARAARGVRAVRLALAALLGGAIGMGANVAAISLAGAAYTCAITASYPALGAAISMIALRERPRRPAVLGIALVSVGIALLGATGGAERGRGVSLGIACACAAALAWALEGVLATSCMERAHSDVLIGLRELYSALCYGALVLAACAFRERTEAPALFSARGMLLLAGAAGAGAASFLCWYRAMARCGAAVGMALNATYALWAAVLDVAVNRAHLRAPAVAGICAMLAGTVATLCAGTPRAPSAGARAHESTTEGNV